LIQKLIGIFLYYSRCPKKVFLYLQSLGVCSSYERVLKLVESEGKNWSQPLERWNKNKNDIDIVADNIDITIKVSFLLISFFPCSILDFQKKKINKII